MKKKFSTRLCPENCIYRNRQAPFCGYCIMLILNEREEKGNADEKDNSGHTD